MDSSIRSSASVSIEKTETHGFRCTPKTAFCKLPVRNFLIDKLCLCSAIVGMNYNVGQIYAWYFSAM